MTPDPLATVLAALRAHGAAPQPKGQNQWHARCPAHDDQRASLSIKRGTDGRALLHCFADCGVKKICAALNLKEAALFADGNGRKTTRAAARRIVEEYPYLDESGELLYVSV